MANKKRQTQADFPLKDARRDLVLHITEGDIKGSKRKDNDACAAATALCRQEHFKEAKVYKTKTYVKLKDGSWERYVTPKALYTEIMVFDRGGRFEAGEFILKAPKGIQKLGAHRKPTGSRLLTGKPSRAIHIVANVRDNAPKGHLQRLLFE
jgi:hypothetical protein